MQGGHHPPPRRQAEDDDEGLGWPVPFAGGFATGFFAGAAIRKFTAAPPAAPPAAPAAPTPLPTVNPLQEKLDALQVACDAAEVRAAEASTAKEAADAATGAAVTGKETAEARAAAAEDARARAEQKAGEAEDIAARAEQRADVVAVEIPKEIRYKDEPQLEWKASLDDIYATVRDDPGGVLSAPCEGHRTVKDDCKEIARLTHRRVLLYGGRHRGPHLRAVYAPTIPHSRAPDLRVLMYVRKGKYAGFAVLQDGMTEEEAHHDATWHGGTFSVYWRIEFPEHSIRQKAGTFYGDVAEAHQDRASEPQSADPLGDD